ncbi:MAG TPA: LemA family protein [Patescibacteria group bacterium]|nr:LemA family protein [Patescibacteria group bacterium]
MNIVVIVFAGLTLWVVITYNGFITLGKRAEEAWSDIDVALKKRWDLVPNLVAAVKAYASHEKTLFSDVTKARTQAMGAGSVHEKDVADGKVKDAIGKLIAVAENYPELRASENFRTLQTELTEIEDTIASARKYYNGTVRNLNIKIHSIPDMVVAGLLGIKDREFFEVDEEERNPVGV